MHALRNKHVITTRFFNIGANISLYEHSKSAHIMLAWILTMNVKE